jgi:hypothetical protein
VYIDDSGSIWVTSADLQRRLFRDGRSLRVLLTLTDVAGVISV